MKGKPKAKKLTGEKAPKMPKGTVQNVVGGDKLQHKPKGKKY